MPSDTINVLFSAVYPPNPGGVSMMVGRDQGWHGQVGRDQETENVSAQSVNIDNLFFYDSFNESFIVSYKDYFLRVTGRFINNWLMEFWIFMFPNKWWHDGHCDVGQ